MATPSPPPNVFDHQCAIELAKFPGGHNGNLSHPHAYATRLRELLRTATATA